MFLNLQVLQVLDHISKHYIVLRFLLIALHPLYLFLLLLSLISLSKMSNIPLPGLFPDLRLPEDHHNCPEDLTIHKIWPNILALGPMQSCCPTPPKEEIIKFRWNTPPLLLQESTLPSEICCCTSPYLFNKPLRLLQDYLEWDQDKEEDDLNPYKRLDLIKEPWHANSLVEINLWMNDHPEYIYIPQNGWLPYLTVKSLISCKPIALHLLSTHMAEVEVLPWHHHFMRIPQLCKSLQMPIHHPFSVHKYPHQVTPFTIQTAESGATFTINDLCYFDKIISQYYKGAGWAFPFSSYKSTWSFHVHGQGFQIFHPDLFPPNFANVFLMKWFISNVNWGNFFQNGDTGDEGVDNGIMNLTNSMDIQDWNLLIDTKFHFELWLFGKQSSGITGTSGIGQLGYTLFSLLAHLYNNLINNELLADIILLL